MMVSNIDGEVQNSDLVTHLINDGKEINWIFCFYIVLYLIIFFVYTIDYWILVETLLI